MKTPLRVAIVAEFYYPHLGGVTEHVHHFALELERRGHVPIVITARMFPRRHDAPFVRRVGWSVVIPSNGALARLAVGPGLRRRIEDILRRERIDLVHVHGGLAPTLGLVAPAAAHRLGLPVVVTFHSWFRRSIGYQVFRPALQRRLDRIAAKIAVSEPVIEALSRYFSAEWEVIPNGVSLEEFHPDGRRPVGPAGEDPRLLFLGRMDPRNGLETVIAAMPRILSHYPRAELVVAGDGPLRPYYERLAASVRGNVRFLGAVHGDRPKLYATADIYLCPSNKASFGITLLEAMACGTPMVVSDIVGFRELVAAGDEAVLAPPGDRQAWAEAVIQLLGNPARRAAAGAAGHRKAAEYAWPRVAERVLEVYRKVL